MTGRSIPMKNTNIIIPGATPNVTMSAKESSCLPISLETFNFLAKNPSKKSKTAPAKMANGARSILQANAKIMAIQPDTKLAAVNRLGTLNIYSCEKLISVLLNQPKLINLRLSVMIAKNTIF